MTWPAAARDLSRQSYIIGEQAAGMGGAYVSLTGDPASAYFNPAGLAGLHRQAISLSASAYWMALEDYDNIVGVELENGEKVTVDTSSITFSTFPASVVYVLPLDSRTDPQTTHHVLAFSLLVPHYDELDGDAVMTAGELLNLVEVKASIFSESATYWAGASYAVSLGGRLRLGLSAYGLVHLSEERYKFSAKVSADDTLGGIVEYYQAASTERSGACVTVLLQAGLQFDLTDRLSLGASVRSPSLGRIYSKVSILYFNSVYAEDIRDNVIPLGGYVDRIETTDVEMDYRLPLMLSLGASYRIPDSFALALDVSYHLSQGPFNQFEGGKVYPLDAAGVPIVDDSRALNPTYQVKNKGVLNVNLGSEISLTRRFKARLGFFTDLSSVDQDYYDTEQKWSAAVTLPSLTRLGITAGLGMIGEWSTSSIGLVYSVGFGDTFQLNSTEGGRQPRSVDVTTHTFTVVLAGTANL
jgi:long-subunit fatty acid transport protein